MDNFSIFAPTKRHDTGRLGIKGWKEDDRPREKSLLNGIQTLTDAELLAILIGSGNKELNAVELSRNILSAADNRLTNLGRLSQKQLCHIKGIGVAKAVIIQAAFEIGRRRRLEESSEAMRLITSRQIADVFIPMLADLPYEEFWIMLLNHANRCITKVKVSQGGVHQTAVDPKLIFRESLQYLATGIVLCHNHPSGNTEPSKQDVELTRQIAEGAKPLSIRVLDHIIIGGDKYFSFADNGILF